MAMRAMMAASLALAVRADEGGSFFDLTAIDIRYARERLLATIAVGLLSVHLLADTESECACLCLGCRFVGMCSLTHSRTGIGIRGQPHPFEQCVLT
jgi:hypothetical protein|eukprot:COSAG02_NODE_149_length_33622_cov_118.075948_8_plen_97_part_00